MSRVRLALPALLPLVGMAAVLGILLGQAVLAVPGLQAGLLFLAPVLALGALLACGHYPGERRLRAAVAWWADRRRRRSVVLGVVVARRRSSSRSLRGGLVVALHLAVRPPPSGSLAA